MRLFLESFVLRGEAQSIKRIVEVYANHDCETQPIESEDAAFILSDIGVDHFEKIDLSVKLSFENDVKIPNLRQ